MNKQKVLLAVVPRLVYSIQQIILATSKIVWINRDRFDGLLKTRTPFILSIWHTNVAYSPILNRDSHIAVMVSESKDGDLITRVVEISKNSAIRGSTSKGGSRVLRQAINHLKKTGPVAITPDGPRGPAFVLQPGIVQTAQVTGAVVLPFHYESTRQALAKSWDQHRIPKPFGKFVCRYGDIVEIRKTNTDEEFEVERVKLEKAMLENRDLAIAEVERLSKKR